MAKTTQPRSGARWSYRGISLEVNTCLVKDGVRFAVPAYVGQGWAHSYLKIVVAAHLLHWRYDWAGINWEYHPSDVSGQHRADVFVRGRGGLPSFWFECRTVSDDKLRHLRSHLPRDVRLVQVLPHDWFLRWWNGEHLRLKPSSDPRAQREAIRRHRAKATVPGVEYWAVYDSSTSARILVAVRADGDDRYTYFDTGEGSSLNWIKKLSRRTDSWAPPIPGIAGRDQDTAQARYLPKCECAQLGLRRLMCGARTLRLSHGPID